MKKQKKNKAIIFDFDGVLVDTYQAVYNINKKADPQMSEKEFKAMLYINVYEYKPIRKPEFPLDFFKEYLKYEKNFIISEDDRLSLKRLSKSNILSINSSNINNVVKRILDLNNLLDLFPKLYGADVEKSKIKKFKMIFKDLKTEPDECLFVADTVSDILEAKAANIKSLAYIGEKSYQSKNNLKQAKPYSYIKDLAEIHDFI
jgi:HAD superfamily hydrolase (TIGR01509 family)